MGGSDDGSGTAQAANHTTDHDPDGGSAAAADVDDNADTAVAATTEEEMLVVPEEKAKANSSGSVEAEGSAAGVSAAGSARKGRGGALCPPDQTSAVEPPLDEGVAATGGDKAIPLTAAAVLPPSLGAGSGGEHSSSSTTGHGANTSKVASGTHSTDGPAPASGSASLGPTGEVRATKLPVASEKDSASLEKQSKDGRRRQEDEQQPQGARKEGKGGEESGGHGGGGSRSKGGESSRAAAAAAIAAEKKKDGGVDGLLENAVSHTVDCLIYIRRCVCMEYTPKKAQKPLGLYLRVRYPPKFQE